MNKKEYNGWANYETWLTYCWLTNDQESYNQLNKLTAKYQGYVLEDAIKDMVENMVSLEIANKASLTTDLVNSAISEVDFREIAKHQIDEVNNE